MKFLAVIAACLLLLVNVVSANVWGSSTFPPGKNNAVRAQVGYADVGLGSFYHFLDFKPQDSTPFDLQSMLITLGGQDYRPAIFTGHYVGGGSIVYEHTWGQRDVVFGAGWLFASGLGLLGWLRRRRAS